MTDIELGCETIHNNSHVFFSLSVISWYIVAVKHSIYNVMVRLETETEKNHNNGCNGTQKQQLMELISDNKSIVNS